MNHSKMIAAKRIAVAVAAVFATLSAPAMAADAKSLLDLMLKKGVITQAEYDEFLKSDAYENQQFKDKRIDDDVSKTVKYVQKHEKDGNVTTNGLGIASADGNFTANLTGRVHMDARVFKSEFTEGKEYLTAGIKGGDAFELRRARLGFTGTIYKDTDYLLLLNMTGASDPNIVEEAWGNHRFGQEVQFRFGRFKQPFNLEEVGTSSNNLDFMQRSYVNALAPAKQIGFMLHGIPMAGTTYAASVYQTGFSQIAANGSYEFAARVTANVAEIASIKDSVIHLGLANTAGNYEVVGAASATSTLLTIRDENRGLDLFSWKEYVGAGSDANGAKYSEKVSKNNLGAEIAVAYGPFKVQYEMSEAKFDAYDTLTSSSDGSGKVKTQYLAAVYNLTGENWSDTYKNGGFGGTKPKKNFSMSGGGLGAWQVGVRYSTYDASDLQLVNSTSAGAASSTISPKGNTTTIGLNWMLNPNARFMLNYAVTRFDSNFTPVSGGNAGDMERVISLRSQFNF